jgi:hypothetical protein
MYGSCASPPTSALLRQGFFLSPIENINTDFGDTKNVSQRRHNPRHRPRAARAFRLAGPWCHRTWQRRRRRRWIRFAASVQSATRQSNRIGARTLAGRLAPSLAAQAAATFTDAPSPGRAAGELFETGETLLVHNAAGTRVVNARSRDDFTAATADLAANMAGLVALNVGDVLGRVDRSLGANRRERAA